MTPAEIRSIVSETSFRDWSINVVGDDTHMFLQVGFIAPNCSRPGETIRHYGRKWILSKHMTRSEIVQTALKAVLTATEHEAREDFTYRGLSIFRPHHDVESLVALCRTGRVDVRESA